MILDRIARRTAGWLSGGGQEADIALSSRARLARNITGFSFLSRIEAAQRREVERLAHQAITDAGLGDDLAYLSLPELSELQTRVLVERRLVSRELAEGEGERGVAVGRGETLSIMVNEEDHLRIQCLRPGFDLEGVWRAADEADDALADKLTYAFSDRFGYLTACPTNVGTGLRVSVMLHLPGLAMSRHIGKVFNAVTKLNLVVRGLYGEGTEAGGDLFQISNQRTLGRSEEDIVQNLASVAPQIVDYERKVREAMLKEKRTQVEDQVWRAYGLLSSARSISSEEALYLLSRARLGMGVGIIDCLSLEQINQLLLMAQPAHVEQLHGSELTSEQRNVCRAELIRNVLAGKRPLEKE